jgi:type IV pilus assembly protein PilC
LVFRLPILGDLFQKAALARWSQTLSSLISAGIPLLDALGPAGDTARNRNFVTATRKICQQLQQGASLSAAMRQQPVFTALPVQMVAIGEESGALDDMLRKIAEIYDREVNDRVSMLNSLLEPLMMVVLGLIIGGMVVAMYLPIFQLGNVL